MVLPTMLFMSGNIPVPVTIWVRGIILICKGESGPSEINRRLSCISMAISLSSRLDTTFSSAWFTRRSKRSLSDLSVSCTHIYWNSSNPSVENPTRSNTMKKRPVLHIDKAKLATAFPSSMDFNIPLTLFNRALTKCPSAGR